MQQYQQVAAEKTALQAQLAQMKKDLDAANAELAADEEGARCSRRLTRALRRHERSRRQRARKEAAEKSLEQSKQQMSEMVGQIS